MTSKEAIQEIINLANNLQIIPSTSTGQAVLMAIKSLEAWELIKDNLSQQVNHNLDAKENFEIGSTSRIECNTTASVLSGVICLIDKHLTEVENGT